MVYKPLLPKKLRFLSPQFWYDKVRYFILFWFQVVAILLFMGAL